MSEIKLALRDGRTGFQPGEEIAGAAGWKLDQPPTEVEVRLFWRTEGKGTTEAVVADTLRFEQPRQEEARPFKFVAPASPHSFSGKLISLVWSLELVASPGKESSNLDLVIAPHRREILLHPAS